MHLKPEDIRKAMENAKALGIIGDEKSRGVGSLMARDQLSKLGLPGKLVLSKRKEKVLGKSYSFDNSR